MFTYRLRKWHRSSSGRTKVFVGNFCRCRVSSSTVQAVVPEEFLSPFKPCNRLRRDGTPIKSCLKTSATKSVARRIDFSLESKADITPPRPTRKSARVTFSPYNQVGALHSQLHASHVCTSTHTITDNFTQVRCIPARCVP